MKNDEIELSLEDFYRLVSNDELEISTDDLNRLIEYYDSKFQFDQKKEKCANRVRKFLLNRDYVKAYENIIELKKMAYFDYKDEIDKGIEICANHNHIEALIYQLNKYTNGFENGINPEVFKYAYILNEWGYVDSFKWLADCYFKGIGCDRNPEKAIKLYEEAVVFGQCEYSLRMLKRICPEIKDYNGVDKWKNLIKIIIYGTWNEEISMLKKMAKLIKAGNDEEYEPECSDALLYIWKDKFIKRRIKRDK